MRVPLKRRLCGPVLVVAFAAFGPWCARATAQSTGPDVIVSKLAGNDDASDILRRSSTGGISAYSMGTQSCNVGSLPVNWYSTSALHPVISQNMFRLKDGRFEQIGQAWLKHGFLAEDEPFCGDCIPTEGSDTLGVGCSDTYIAFLNGNQTLLGPKSQVNASRGTFPYPFTAPSAPPGIGRRLQVHDSDLEAALNPGARYFVEGHYVASDDALFNNAWNNASWREITFTPTFPFEPSAIGPTYQMEPGIMAWVADDPTVQFAQIFVTDDGGPGYLGFFWVAGQATFLGGCTWHYEYAVQNLNSFQSGGTFSVDLPEGVTVTNIGFHDVDYHSGEPYSGADWPATVSSNSISWATQPFADNINANALRWATLYNFRFDADAPPTCYGNVSLGLFRTPSRTLNTLMIGPGAGTGCFKDGDIDKDCDIDGDDFGLFLAAFGYCQEAFEYSAGADMEDNGCVDLVDYQFWLTRYREFIGDPLAPPPELGLPPLLGDMNGDAQINLFDVPDFVDVLLGLDTEDRRILAADMDENGLPDGRDVRLFCTALLSGN
ncbi:MAG TPA: hypothetical protein VJZ71_19410 [Phycisphaerae bacterium]|nr:hypothetical protein [Phycisphaerae bacterium]